MNELLSQTDESLKERSKSLFCAFKFGMSKRAGFNAVLSLASRADIFLEITDNGKSFFLAGFGKSAQQLALCFAFAEEVRVNCSIKYMTFADGKLLKNKNQILNIVSCAIGRTNSPSEGRYCLDEYSNPIAHFAKREGLDLEVGARLGAENETHSWILPCKLLNGCLSLEASELNEPLTKIKSVAKDRLISACPHFYAERFEVKEKAKKISRPKRYW